MRQTKSDRSGAKKYNLIPKKVKVVKKKETKGDE
jgi:hypothetical protein